MDQVIIENKILMILFILLSFILLFVVISNVYDYIYLRNTNNYNNFFRRWSEWKLH